MPRKAHRKLEDENEEDGKITFGGICLKLPAKLVAFLDTEAKRMTEEKGKYVRKSDIIRALIVAYYEKRAAQLLIGPND